MTGPIPTKARQEVGVRDNSQCRRCGMRGHEIHHRKRRREGGHGLENLVLLCRPCHAWAHANPTLAMERGYIVSVFSEDVASVPLQTFAGPMLFHPDGAVTYL